MKIGIIGGSGLDDPDIIGDLRNHPCVTPYGDITVKSGKLKGVEIVFIPRHGSHHQFSPTHVNYRANIQALKDLNVTHIIATNACGSLKAEIDRSDFVIPSQFIDFTRHRINTFHDDFSKGMHHEVMADPFDSDLSDLLYTVGRDLGFRIHKDKTLVTIEGPRFSTRAESRMFIQWGADIINMTVATEAALAKEAGIAYAVIAMSTDYDCWKEDEEMPAWQEILEIFNKNVDNVKEILLGAIHRLSQLTSPEPSAEIPDTDAGLMYDNIRDYIKGKVRSIPDWPIKGVIFRDITTLLQDPLAFKEICSIFYKRYAKEKIDKIVGIDARGFLFGAVLAYELGIGFIPIRKKGKLPYKTNSLSYSLEYGEETIEIHEDAIQKGERVVIIDDLMATGGTISAAANLVDKLGGNIVECAFVIELPDLKGREKLGNRKVFSIIAFEGE
jgi:5'-methylthioadenosine phosphorylase